MNSQNGQSENQELIKLFEIANQRLRHIHDALWKEEAHYTWLIYILVAGAILALNVNDLPIVAIVLSAIGIGICWVGFFVLKEKENSSKKQIKAFANTLLN